MRFGAALFVTTLAGASMTISHSGAASLSKTIRVLTYNIHHGEGMDGVFNLARLATIIMSTTPDLVAIQEVDEGTGRAGGVYQLQELAKLTGLHATFGRAMEFDGGGYGIGILSRWNVVSVSQEALPRIEDREPRTALTVRVDPGDGASLIDFTNTHFDAGRDVDGRDLQAGAINQRLAARDDVVSILAGDLNSRGDSDALGILRAQWTEVSPDTLLPLASGRPGMRVDYVLVRPASRFTVIDAQVIDAPIASDHRPVPHGSRTETGQFELDIYPKSFQHGVRGDHGDPTNPKALLAGSARSVIPAISAVKV